MRGSCKGKHLPFYEKPLCRLQGFYADGRNYPRVEAEDDVLLIYFRLCKAGYSNSIIEARELDARTVLQALAYEKFIIDWEQAYIEENK